MSEKTPEELTNQDVAKDISTIAHIFRNGYCVFKSTYRFDQSEMIFLRNKILFELFDNNHKLDHPSVRSADFHKYGHPKDIRRILSELCENRGGRWYFKNHDTDTLYDVYQQFDDKTFVKEITDDIEAQKQATEEYFSKNNN